MIRAKNCLRSLNVRWLSSAPPMPNIVEQLSERSLLKVSGEEVDNFLQGLITNDINHLQKGIGNMYTMFLNTKGRVLYDAIIYRTEEKKSFLIECDKQATESLKKHIKMYRVRRKIDVSDLNEFKIYALFNPSKIMRNGNNKTTMVSKNLEGLIIPCTSLNTTPTESSSAYKIYKDMLIYCDPRSAIFGFRILAPLKFDVRQEISEIFNINQTPQPDHTYRWFRYNLGIGEGINDLPPGNCFPLEANCDYLHGVSFHKGCYVGQELTARTHHTGVVRKRLMPLYFSHIASVLPTENTIVHENVNLGKLRGVEGNVGLALIRIAKALEFKEITVGNGIATIEKPPWWPLEAPKEPQNIMDMKVNDNAATTEDTDVKKQNQEAEIKYFCCCSCFLKEKYEYFGKSPPWVKDYKLNEDAYFIEDPFMPPKQEEFIILGAHCIKCSKTVCKDSNCSFYFDGTYCLMCAKKFNSRFPLPVQQKLNKIV